MSTARPEAAARIIPSARPRDARSWRCSCCNPRLRSVEAGVRQRPAAARRRGSTMQAPAAHDSRAKSQTTRHAWQAMGRAAGRAGSRTIMAVKAAATHDAKDARRSRALSTRRGWKEEGGEKHETGAHADSDCLARSMSGLRLCTLRCGGRARVQSHHWRRDARGLQRCTRSDLTHSDSRRQIPATLVWT